MKLTKFFFVLAQVFALTLAVYTQTINPYPTVTEAVTGLQVRGFYNQSKTYNFENKTINLAPTMSTEEGSVLVSFFAGYRPEPGEANIFFWATNSLSTEKARLSISLKSNNPFKSSSFRFEDNNAFVLAWLKPGGLVGEEIRSFMDTSHGVYDWTGSWSKFGEDGWSEEIVFDLPIMPGKNSFAILGRPATTDSCPTCSLTMKIKLLEGVASSQNMLGDNQVWLTKQVDERRLLAAVQRAPRCLIAVPQLGQLLWSQDPRVEQILRVRSYDPAWSLLRQSLLAELQVVARGMDPFETTIGQQEAIDSQLFRSAAASNETVDQVVFHGGCTVGGLAVNLSRAYFSVRSDPRNWPDLNGIAPFLNQLYGW